MVRKNREPGTENRAPGSRFSVLVLLLALYAAMMAGVLPAASGPAAQGGQPLLVRIRAATPADGQRLAELGIDLMEARNGADLFALATPAELEMLRAAGWDARVAPGEIEPGAGTAAFMGGYRTVEEIEQLLRASAASYPGLATLEDFGDSWERAQPGGLPGYDLLALRLTNTAIPGPKPIFFLMAAIHARELSTTEVAARFISYLLEGYGRDADITWLLDEHEIIVAPIINPDGRKIAEQSLWQRKNTNTTYSSICAIPSIGVDLNRNASSRFWGLTGIDPEPCGELFPGGGPASEPETQALERYVSGLFPSRARPEHGEAAPEDSDGLLISLHSFGDLVLWPWGHTASPAPNGPALARLGERFASFNGYTAQQAYRLYFTSGTTDEWAYGTLGIAAYTFEIGPASGECRLFMPPYSCMDNFSAGRFWPRNLPALLYGARVARAPFSQPAGPDVRSAALLSDTATLTLTADLDGRGQALAGAELYVEVSPWRGGTPIPLLPEDGAFDSAAEQARVVLPLSELPPGAGGRPALLLLRARGAAGAWGPISAVWSTATWTPPPPDWQRTYLPLMTR